MKNKKSGKKVAADTTQERGYKLYTNPAGDKLYVSGEGNAADTKAVQKAIANFLRRENLVYKSKGDKKIWNPGMFFSDNLLAAGIWTNGSVVIRDAAVAEKLILKSRTLFEPQDYTEPSTLNIDHVVPKDLTLYAPAAFIGAKSDSKFDRMIYQKPCGEIIYLEATYVSLLYHEFPDSELLFCDSVTPAIFLDSGVVKGITMPITIRDQDTARERLETFLANTTGPDEYEKQAERIKNSHPDDIYSDEKLRRPDGTLYKPLSHKSLNWSMYKKPREKNIFKLLKVTNVIADHPLKTVFNYSREGEDAGVWTDSRMLILDREITKQIYTINRQRFVLNYLAKYPGDPEEGKALAIQEINEKSEEGVFVDYTRVIPSKEKTYPNEAEFTGEYYATDKAKILIYFDGEQEVALEANYVATLRSKFPDSKIYFGSSVNYSEKDIRPAVFVVDGEIKAVLMSGTIPAKEKREILAE